MTKRNHRAASLKAWRTRRKMMAGRKELEANYRAFLREREARAEYGPEYLELIKNIGKEKPRRGYARVLPCPDFGSVR